MPRIALIGGATGLVGRELVSLLLGSPVYQRVRVLVRRPLLFSHTRLEEVRTDYSDLAALGDKLKVDDAFCCLGTTLRKAGSKEAFEAVDYGHVLALARAAQAAGVKRFLVVSAAGTSEHSAAFYSQVKARMEKDVATLGFESIHIVRPSLLLGNREESRPGERLGQILSPLISPLMLGGLRKYRPVRAGDVARAMMTLAQPEAPAGVQIHHLPLDR